MTAQRTARFASENRRSTKTAYDLAKGAGDGDALSHCEAEANWSKPMGVWVSTIDHEAN